MSEEHTNLEINSKDIAVKYRGSAICLMILSCIVGIVLCSIYVEEKMVKYAAVFFLFLGMMNLINIFAATLGLTVRE